MSAAELGGSNFDGADFNDADIADADFTSATTAGIKNIEAAKNKNRAKGLVTMP